MNVFEALGFTWERVVIPTDMPVHDVKRATFRFSRMLSEFVWDAGALENNPFTYPEVKTLLDGITVGGHKISDERQILNLAESSRRLLKQVRETTFRLDKATFCSLHALVAYEEALEWGHFRGEGREVSYWPHVALGEHGQFSPPPTEPFAPTLNRIFDDGLRALTSEVRLPFEQATAFFLFGALQQFFFDGNKRTSRFMMNGVLMSAGIDAISVPAAKAQEFNEKMVDFYRSKSGTEMMVFLIDCHPDAKIIRTRNPHLPVGA